MIIVNTITDKQFDVSINYNFHYQAMMIYYQILHVVIYIRAMNSGARHRIIPVGVSARDVNDGHHAVSGSVSMV